MPEIAGVCDEVPERDRHGDAAREHGEAERGLQHGVRETEAWRPSPPGRALPLSPLRVDHPAREVPPQECRERQRSEQNKDPEPKVSRPPARCLVEIAEYRRPNGAGNPLSGREQSDREAAPVLEPAHHVDHQRANDRGLAKQTHHDAVDGVELPLLAEHAGEQGADPDHQHAEPGHRPRARAVEPVAHHDAADPRAEKEAGVGEGGHAPGPIEVEGNLFEPHHEHEHAAVRAQDEKDRDEQHDVAEARRDARIVLRRERDGHVGSQRAVAHSTPRAMPSEIAR